MTTPTGFRWTVAACAAALLVGCAAGPDFQAPAAPSDAAVLFAPLPTHTASAATALGGAQHFSAGVDLSAPWWQQLGAPALDALIAQALAASPTLAAAEATLRQAQATQSAQASATQLPRVDASAGAGRQHTSPSAQGLTGDGRSFDQYSASIGLRYTLDISGGNRRALEALGARTNYQRYQHQAARLNLEYTRITAPVNGRISRAQVTVGNVVAAGAVSAPLTTLVSTARMYAAFDVDEPTYLKMAQASRAGSGAIPVHLGLANEEGHPRKGTVSFIDNRLDVASGTIRVRAVFDNPDGQLIPGLYARVQLGGGKPRDALLIDERAVGTDQVKRFVLVLDEGNRTSYREVRLGNASGGLRVVDAGLKAGERIVVNGLQRVRPGEPVAPREVPMAGQPGRFAGDGPPADGQPSGTPAGRQPKQV